MIGNNFVGLAWESNGGANQYNVYREADGEVEYLGYAKVDTFYDRTAEPNVTYTYYIKAANASGESETSNVVEVTTGYLTVLTNHMEEYVRTEDITGTAVSQLTNTLKQVKHHVERGSTNQAQKFLAKFSKQLDKAEGRENVSPLAYAI